MRKHLCLLLSALFLTTVLTACEKNDQAVSTETVSPTETASETETSANTIDPQADYIDLTSLSSTVIYAEVYMMMQEPDKYVGKTIKMNGLYVTDYWEETDKNYYFVLIKDAEACCQQGLEFILKDGLTYPPDSSTITVTGVFRSYEELGNTYYYVDADEIEVTG